LQQEKLVALLDLQGFQNSPPLLNCYAMVTPANGHPFIGFWNVMKGNCPPLAGQKPK